MTVRLYWDVVGRSQLAVALYMNWNLVSYLFQSRVECLEVKGYRYLVVLSGFHYSVIPIALGHFLNDQLHSNLLHQYLVGQTFMLFIQDFETFI